MSSKDPLHRDRAEVFGLVFLVAQQLTRLADEELVEVGLTTSQWLLLAVLMRRFPGESPRLSEAAAVYGSSRQNVKQIAQQLEARGFLEIRRDPADARSLRLHVTRKVALFDQPSALARQGRMMDSMFASLDPVAVGELERLLRRWLAGLLGQGAPRAKASSKEG